MRNLVLQKYYWENVLPNDQKKKKGESLSIYALQSTFEDFEKSTSAIKISRSELSGFRS